MFFVGCVDQIDLVGCVGGVGGQFGYVFFVEYFFFDVVNVQYVKFFVNDMVLYQVLIWFRQSSI